MTTESRDEEEMMLHQLLTMLILFLPPPQTTDSRFMELVLVFVSVCVREVVRSFVFFGRVVSPVPRSVFGVIVCEKLVPVDLLLPSIVHMQGRKSKLISFE